MASRLSDSEDIESSDDGSWQRGHRRAASRRRRRKRRVIARYDQRPQLCEPAAVPPTMPGSESRALAPSSSSPADTRGHRTGAAQLERCCPTNTVTAVAMSTTSTTGKMSHMGEATRTAPTRSRSQAEHEELVVILPDSGVQVDNFKLNGEGSCSGAVGTILNLEMAADHDPIVDSETTRTVTACASGQQQLHTMTARAAAAP